MGVPFVLSSPWLLLWWLVGSHISDKHIVRKLERRLGQRQTILGGRRRNEGSNGKEGGQ